MYAKEMRSTKERHSVPKGGYGDGPPATLEKETRDATPSSSLENDDFLFGYGHYGNPHSFAPYQILLILIDFIFNCSMDLSYEYPLAVLVIFVFQSLAIIINLILYIMASANQAMQVGLHKRVTIHHWLNLGACLLYMTLTGWWFIWALRKSWPSVSDEFSFTWPAAGLQPVMNSSLNNGTLKGGVNVTRRATMKKSDNGNNQSHSNSDGIKEHYTLWSDGFIALYVVHRTVAILYYFIYLRATFLVLNTPEIERFVEKKKNLVERFWEAKKAEKAERKGISNRKKRSILTNAYTEEEAGISHPPFSLGLHDYLAESSKFLMEGEALRQESQRDNIVERPATAKGSRSKRQILWADDENIHRGERSEVLKVNDTSPMEPNPIGVRKVKPPKPRRRGRDDLEDDEETATRLQVDIDEDEMDRGRNGESKKVRATRRPKPGSSSRRSSREEIDD